MKGSKPEEKWEQIPNFKNYLLSNSGKIKSIARKVWHSGSKTEMTLKSKMMRQRWNKKCKCYFLDLMDDDKKRKTIYPHREVAKLYVHNDDETKTMIIHQDNNPRNNTSVNLKWMTPSQHMSWQFEMGNKNNFKVWKTRKKLYANGFKDTTVLPGRPKNKAS